jgi:RimJ/RimL family protein N-acetyltransferase
MQYLTGRLMPARFIATGDIHPRRKPSSIMVPLRHGAGMSIFDLRIETERLILRPLLREDYEPYLAFCADEATMRTLGGVQPPSVAWRGFCSLAGAWQLFGFSMFSVIEKSSGDWIGRMGPWQPQDWPGTEVGWGIRHASWGRGYAPEAAVAAIDWAFDTLGWDEVIHTIAEDNDNSRAVARKLAAPCCAWGSCQRRTTTSPCRSGASRANSGGNAR